MLAAVAGMLAAAAGVSAAVLEVIVLVTVVLGIQLKPLYQHRMKSRIYTFATQRH